MAIEMRSESKGAESDYMSAPGETPGQDNVYDNLEHPASTSNNPSPGTVRPGPIATRVILAVLTVSLLVLGAIVVWRIAGGGDGSRTKPSALADATMNMTRSVQDQASKLEVMSEQIQNLTAAGLVQAKQHEAQINQLEERIQNLSAATQAQIDLISRSLGFADCQEHRDHGSSQSGVYNIGGYMSQLPVYCDMTTNGGGWTVVLRRKDGSVDFDQTWEAYKNGFGNLSGEFWAGNELMFQMTSRPGKTYRLRVELGSYDGRSAYAEYNVFRVDSEREFYRLHVSGYTGTAGDSLIYHDTAMFSTRDAEHDTSIGDCAKIFHGGWWFKNCHQSTLTDQYGTGLPSTRGIMWLHWLGYDVQLKSALMMVRPV